MSAVPAIRVRKVNQATIRGGGKYVLYWMIASRRLHYNFALDRAVEHCAALKKPLVILEALRVGYRWASDRIHRFVIGGMLDNAERCAEGRVLYYPFVESGAKAGKGLLQTLTEEACVVVTDEFPCFFLPGMVERAGKRLNVLLEAVDSNGLLPIYACEQAMGRAFDFRRFLQKELPRYLSDFPKADPLARANLPKGPALPAKIGVPWPAASEDLLSGDGECLKLLSIDHNVRPVKLRGGHSRGKAQLRDFLERKLRVYSEKRNEPELDVTSRLSPFLHFGHLSAHEVFTELARREKWKPEKISLRANGRREGWWNMSANAESFLDEMITWRELGFNFCVHRRDYERYESLPDWAKKTLQEHAADQREHIYSVEEFEAAKTHDPLWNAAQRQLVEEGIIHNYLRMLWGKKILEWSRTPHEAAETMIHLNNKYALDGRDPNSYSGIFWVLGRYDRPWAPARPVFGTIRYMSSENTARKMSVKNYIKKHAGEGEQGSLEF